MSERCVEGVLKVPQRLLEGIWEASSQDMSSGVYQVGKNQIGTGQVWTGEFRKGIARTGQFKSVHVKSFTG